MDWKDAIEEAEEDFESGYAYEESYEGEYSKEGNELSPVFARARDIIRRRYQEEASYNYKRYLKGKWWLSMRKRVLARDNNACVDCEGMAWQVHHITYENKGNEMEFYDCISLCDTCHKKRHGLKVVVE